MEGELKIEDSKFKSLNFQFNFFIIITISILFILKKFF